MLWNEREALQRASLTPSTGLPVEFGMEALTAGFDFARGEETSTSLERALWEEYDSYLDQVEQRTGQRIENPIGFAPRAPRPGMTGQLKRQPQDQPALPSTGMAAFDTRIAELRKKDPELPAPPSASQLLDRITGRLGSERAKYQDLQSRMTTGGGIASFLGSTGGVLTDPLVAATLPFGAGASRPLVAKMLIEAGIAGASELAVQPYIMRGKEAIESPYTFGDAAENVLAAAGLGAAFPAAAALLHAGGVAAVRRLSRVFDAERPAVRPASPLERAALDDAERAAMTEEASPLATTDLPAHVDRVENDAAAFRETGKIEIPDTIAPELRRDSIPPPEPVRLAEVEDAGRLDDVTREEIGRLVKEDEDLGRAMEVMAGVRAAVLPNSPDLSREARFARAKEQGFNTETVFYHGSDADIGEFRPSERGGVGPGVYSTPQAGVAEKYGDAVYPVVLRGKIFNATGSAGRMAPSGYQPAWIPKDEAARLLDGISNEKLHGQIKRQMSDPELEGVSGDVVWNDMRANFGDEEAQRRIRAAGYDHIMASVDGTEVVTFDPVNIRSVHAEFHPDSTGRADILGRAPVPDPAAAAKELAEFTGSKAEDAALTADVERALTPTPTPMTPEQIAANKKLRRSMAAQKGALAVRRDTEDSRGRPKSLLAYLKQAGGIRDEGGELEARDLRTSRPGLVRRQGHTLEDAAFMAWEDGFLPEATQIMPDGSGIEPGPDLLRQFMDAIDEELRGRKRYSERTDEKAIARLEAEHSAKQAEIDDAALAGMRQDADELGLDVPDEMLWEAQFQFKHYRDEYPSGYDYRDVLVHLVEQDALRLADDWEAPVAAAADDIPFEPSQAPRVDRAPAGTQQATGGDAGRAAGTVAGGQESARGRPAGEAAGARSEPGAEGFDQLVIPGAERSAQQAMDARAGRGMRSAKQQVGMSDGLFAPMDDPRQMQIPVAETLDGAELRTAADLLDDLEHDRRAIEAMSQCASPLPGVKP